LRPTLDIIIVNWNAGRQLHDCLQSIACSPDYSLSGVIVIDNGSTDDSLEALNSGDIPVSVVRNDTNRGFAAACNQGAAERTADYLLFLNPDTILNSDSLSGPIVFLEDPTNSSIGIVGIKLVDENGAPNPWCCRFPTPRMFFHEMSGLSHIKPDLFPGYVMTEWNHEDSRDVDHLLGAFYLMRRRVFVEMGGFDERFFVYKEDLDFSLRAKRAGWRSHYLAEFSAYHRGGGSSHQIKATRLFYAMRSRIQYGYKHFGWMSATGLVAGTFLFEPVARVLWAIMRGSGREVIETICGTSRLLAWAAVYPFRQRGSGFS
jgi:GT2 family glycosyltransferase